MRDFLLNEALKRLATEAATRFSSLVASGDQIPFDVAAESGDDASFFSYVPLTSRFVEERAQELRSLPSFGPAREAAVEAGVAAGYLESRGEAVPADPGERAERMLTIFISALWEGSTEFSLDRARLDSALSMLDAEARGADDAEVVIVPVVGLRMSMARLQLPHGVRVVRADAIEAPIEAMRSEGMGRASWEPQYLAVADQHEEEGAEAALNQLRELISVMRLFKAGGIGLGPYAFAPTGEDCWRRIATGAPATRPGGYRLSEAEATELIELANTLEARPDPDSALTWAVGRFEMGCERESALDGLSDHLLALRAVLEGHGPVGASLPLRASALISDDSLGRIEAREKVEDTLELERALMNGRSLENGIQLAGWAENGVRRLLLQAALGELGSDLSATADETLIATGLDGGDAEIAFTAGEEIDAVDEPVEPEPAPSIEAIRPPEPVESVPEFRIEQLPSPVVPPEPIAIDSSTEETDMEQDTRIMEPIPAEDEIKITATPWLEEVSDARRGDSLEWPAASERDIEHRERIDTPRVRHLFPVPEDADWEVSHLEFDYGHYTGPSRHAS
ncbi:MAG TPA: hypothetical protein VGO13_10445 [Solirubrobacterales bacterium]|nr:hypothetical protein [Solirubrobacterales bacterium]